MNVYAMDIIFAILFLIYAFLLLLGSKYLEKLGFSKDGTRKFVHVFMGLVIIVIPSAFKHVEIALIPPILFTIINLVDYKYGLLSQIQGEDRGNVGTVLYPISFVILILVFYGTDYWALAVLGILTMAFGDAGASIIGRAYGKNNTYFVHGEPRSYAGSLTMFGTTFILTILIFTIFGGSLGITVRVFTLLAAGFLIAGIATIIEALSLWGSDNITVPTLTALSAWVLLTQFMPNVLGNQAIVNQPLF